MLASASLFRRFNNTLRPTDSRCFLFIFVQHERYVTSYNKDMMMITNLYGIGFVKILKTRQKISVDSLYGYFYSDE